MDKTGGQQVVDRDTDRSGRSRLVRNVGASYLGHMVLVVFGFIMPRAIDENVGQIGLGVWDFCWTFVNYLNFTSLGIGTSVNRYVARYRAADDSLALSKLVSTVNGLQIIIAVCVLGASICLALFVPIAFEERLGSESRIAGAVVGLLGASLAVQMAFDAWRGVLSGCHRWDYYNAINAVSHALSGISMIAALLLGGGLISIASVYLVVTILTEVSRFVIARKVCPEIELSLALVSRRDAVKATKFGIKSIMLYLPEMIITQTVNVVVVAKLGPAALAVLARPLALTRHVSTFITKYSFILTPTAGSLQSQGKQRELSEFALESSRNGWLLATPPLVFLFLMGDLVAEIWMGPSYANWGVFAVLSAGLLIPISQSPLVRVMMGMDTHGAIARTGMFVSILIFVVGLAIVEFIGWSLLGAASVVAASLGVGQGLVILRYGLKFLSISLAEYVRTVMRRPLVLAFALCSTLSAIRLFLSYGAGTTLVIAMACTGIVSLMILRKEVDALIRSVRKS